MHLAEMRGRLTGQNVFMEKRPKRKRRQTSSLFVSQRLLSGRVERAHFVALRGGNVCR